MRWFIMLALTGCRQPAPGDDNKTQAHADCPGACDDSTEGSTDGGSGGNTSGGTDSATDGGNGGESGGSAGGGSAGGGSADGGSADGSTGGAGGGTDGGADGGSASDGGAGGGADGSTGSGTDGGSDTGAVDGAGSAVSSVRTGYNYNDFAYDGRARRWDGGETITWLDGAGTVLCEAPGGTWGEPTTSSDCPACDWVWDMEVYFNAGTGSSCADFGHDVRVTFTRTLGYAATWDDGGTPRANALVARNPSGDWVWLGTAVLGGSIAVTYTLEPGMPDWE